MDYYTKDKKRGYKIPAAIKKDTDKTSKKNRGEVLMFKHRVLLFLCSFLSFIIFFIESSENKMIV